MDEGTLNDLLECSVCLDRLDTSSKVLPCQHTFCRKCLEEIVQKHKELRCPECRVLVKIKIDDLPPNVLLMRILEGMRNSSNVPKKQQRIIRGTTTTTANQIPLFVQQHQLLQQQQQATPERKINNKQTSPHIPATHQPYAKALYDYEPKEPGDLSFKRGDIVFLKKRIDAHWFQGECHGKQGLFPLNYVQVITPLPSHMPQCKALYDFQTDKHEEEGCLVFKEGDIITVIRRVDENWAEGKLDGRIGIFPLTFVELNNLARSLMKLSTNSQPGPSRIAPPTPTTEDSTPLIPTDHSRVVVQQPVVQQNLPTSDSSSTLSSGTSSTTTTTPNVSSSNTSSNASTAPSSPASPPPRTQPIPRNMAQKVDVLGMSHTSPNNHQQTNSNNKEKRHSFTGLTAMTFNKSSSSSSSTASVAATNHHRHSAEISGSNNELHDDIKLPANYIALYPYKPQKSDELELRKGSLYIVTERCQDGWYKGTSARTQKSGVFPGNYVAYIDKKTGTITNNGGTINCNNQIDPKIAVSFTRGGKSSSSQSTSSSSSLLLLSPRQQQSFSNLPPELPPRSISPAVNPTTISSSWHGQQQDNAACVAIGRSSSAIMPSSASTQQQVTIATAATPTKTIDKSKDRKEKGVGLMRRLTSIKRSKSPPPPSTYSMDNPVFEDTVATAHPVHVRSGSCPSQLLQIQPTVEHHRLFGSTSQRLKHKERPSVLTHTLRTENSAGSSCSSPDVVHHYNNHHHHHQHRKSNSLDANNGGGNNHRQQTKATTVVHTVNELFRCEIPYPPNSEYELELQKDDIIYVHKKREDGWYKGTLQRTGRTGLFPASFVRPV